MKNKKYETFLASSTSSRNNKGLSENRSSVDINKEKEIKYLTYEKEQMFNSELRRQQDHIEDLTKKLSEARIIKEYADLQIKDLQLQVKSLLSKLNDRDALEKEIKVVREQMNVMQIVDDNLRNEIKGLKESNTRMSELIGESEEYKLLSKMAKPTQKEKENGLETTQIRYLRGSEAVGKKDLRNILLGSKKFHWTYKFWDKLSANGRLEEEEMLWTPERAVEIVKEYDSGKFSKNRELAIEKLLFEVD